MLVSLTHGTEDFQLVNLKEQKALMYFFFNNENHSRTDVGHNQNYNNSVQNRQSNVMLQGTDSCNSFGEVIIGEEILYFD